jgi:uncharacterized protein YukE
MNITDVQKMNALASELRKNHFAGSSVDAYQQAQDIMHSREEHKDSVPSRDHSVVQDQAALFEKRFQLILEMNNKKYDQEFALLRSAINQLVGELNMVRGELQKAREQIHEAPKPKEVQQPLKTEVKEAHPRQGNFTSSDVDIKKMFYFGTKK